MKTRFQSVEKLANKMFNAIKTKLNNPDGLTKNSTGGKMPLVKEIILRRKHVDVSEVDVFFHPCAKDGKVFIVTNNKEHSDIDLAINGFQEHIKQQIHQKNTAS